MSVVELEEPRIRVTRHMSVAPPGSLRPRRRPPWVLIGAYIAAALLIGYYGVNLYRIGVDAREGFWVYWEPNRFQGDLRNAVNQSNLVLREAEVVAAEDLQKLTPQQRADREKLNAIQPLATLMAPGPGLFDRPWSPRILRDRWHRLRPVYSQIYRAWVRTYDRLERDSASGDYDLDYPPLRLMTMTLWTWKIETTYPGLSDYPSNPQQFTDPVTRKTIYATQSVVRPMLMLNRAFDMVSTVSMFFLVWIWANRVPSGGGRASGTLAKIPGFAWMRRREFPLLPQALGWRARWGDPLLLAPAIVLLISETYIRPRLNFDLAVLRSPVPSYIDDRVSSLGWWLFITLRFVAVVALARLLPRPFRGPACGMIAATLVWLNPASILDSFGWPQWDVWIPPFFLLAAVLISVDWWLTAGLVLGVGVMFKGQLLFISPILILCPLLAGWLGRFTRIATGMAIGMAAVLWPWLTRAPSAKGFILSTIFAALIVCVLSIFRRPLARELNRAWLVPVAFARQKWQQRRNWRESMPQAPPLPRVGLEMRLPAIATVLAGLLTAYLLTADVWWRAQPASIHPFAALLTAGILILPWFIPRRMIFQWLITVSAAAVWIGATAFHGGFSWWSVGFMNGTKKHDLMQLGTQSLSNFSSILEKRYRWQLHDLAGTFRTSDFVTPQLLTSQHATAIAAILTVGAILLGAQLFVRRRNARGLPLLGGTWALLMALLWLVARPRTLLSAGSYEWEVRTSLGILFMLTLLLCSIGAAMHLRRRDPRFLIAITAPWVLFVALLTQLAARYTILPSIVAACLVGVSVGMSLFHVLLVTIACVMLGNQMLNFNTAIAPLSHMITRPTHPDLGWVMLLLAGFFLIASLVPSKRGSPAPLS